MRENGHRAGPGRLGTMQQPDRPPCQLSAEPPAGSCMKRLVDLNQNDAGVGLLNGAMWRPVSTAPFDRDLRLAVLAQSGDAHALVFPCRRVVGCLVKSETRQRLELSPSHWQEWEETFRLVAY